MIVIYYYISAHVGGAIPLFMSRFWIVIFVALQFIWTIFSFGFLWPQMALDERALCQYHFGCDKTVHSFRDTAKENGARQPYLLAVLVLSSVEGKERRETIRSSWMKLSANASVLVRFVIGTSGLSDRQLAPIYAELEEGHEDLLFLPHLHDSYLNLTRKVLYAFKWLDENVKFLYVLKVDDDSFVVLNALMDELSTRNSQRSLYWGFFDGRATPKSKGKWTEDEWFLCDRYLPYALGGGYVLSQDLVHAISVNADKLRIYNSEDVSVGVWVSSFDAERKHDVRFNTEYVSRGCRNSYLVSHKQSNDEIRDKYYSLKMRGVQCSQEYQTRPSYEYKWNEVPSKCCERSPDIP